MRQLSNKRSSIKVLSAAVLLAWLAACASTPPVEQAPAFDAAAAVAAIRAAGSSSAKELVIRPLGSNGVEDLRDQSTRLEAEGRYADAAAVLDQALAISPDDPVLLQERAEAALLLHDLDTAERLARQAAATGTEVGPQCRRHWETVAQVLALRAPPEPAADGSASPQPQPATSAAVVEARRQRDACTVAAPPRY